MRYDLEAKGYGKVQSWADNYMSILLSPRCSDHVEEMVQEDLERDREELRRKYPDLMKRADAYILRTLLAVAKNEPSKK